MPHLLSPLSVAGVTLRNRIVMPPMWSGQAAPDGSVTDAIVEYHRVRARAGCGLVIVEHAFVDPRGRASETQLGIDDDARVPGLTRLAAAIRAEGAVACQQISHAGARSSTKLLGRTPLAPSAVVYPSEPAGEVPAAATAADLVGVREAFAQAAARAKRAGFDAVEIHAAHGFLLSEFLSPLTNRRFDEYGGAFINRVRLHLEVLAAVRVAVGPTYPVFVRLGAHDEMAGGLELDEAVQAAVALTRADGGVSLVDVSGGLQGSRGIGKPAGYFVAYAEAVKRATGPVPVAVAGGINDPRHADTLVRESRTDLVGIGRAMLNDAEWAAKAVAVLGGA
jgi:NADPH2 dehydrogenase